MTKLLGVVGSLRRNGNTHILVSRILDGARTEGATGDIPSSTIWIFVNTTAVTLAGRAASAVRTKIKNENMPTIYPKLIGCDVIIFGRPVYWYGPTAVMKDFIDRFVYFNCPEYRAQIQGKSAVLAVSFEETNPETAALLIVVFEKSLQYEQVHFVGRIIVRALLAKAKS